MNFCIKKYIGTQGEVWSLSTVKISPPPHPHPRHPPTPVVYATDRSKAVEPVLFLSCVALWFILRGASCFPVLFVLVFLHSFLHCDHLAWGRGHWFVCFSCICLFVLYVLVFVIFLFLLVSGLGWVCDCGTPWTFLLTFLYHIDLAFYSQDKRQISFTNM